MFSGINVSRDRLLGMREDELERFVQSIDQAPSRNKTAYVIELVQTASSVELMQLDRLRSGFVSMPIAGSFWFRLDQAVNIRIKSTEFEKGQVSGVSSFYGLTADSMICFRELILPLSEQASKGIVQKARFDLAPLEFLEFNEKIQRMAGLPGVDAKCPPIIATFNTAAETIRGELEESEELSSYRP